MEIHPFVIGNSSFSMGHLYHGYVSHNQRVWDMNNTIIEDVDVLFLDSQDWIYTGHGI